MIVSVSSLVFPTEDRNKVISAVTSFFGATEAAYRHDVGQVHARTTGRQSLEMIRNIVHSMRIIDAVRTAVLRNLIGLETRILIDKQAAYHGKFRLLDDREEEPSLGVIEISMQFEHETEFEEFLKWFVPPTKDGKILQSKP